MEIPLIWYSDYTDQQLEDAVRSLATRMEHQRGEYIINQMAQNEIVRILSNRKVQAVVKSVLDGEEENDPEL